MKNRIVRLVSCICLLLVISGCSGINVNIGINDSKEADSDLKEISLENLATTNSFDSLIKRNGKVLYTLGSYMRDGSQEEYTIYKDDKRYVVNDINGTLIIEDNEAYGYDQVADCPFRMLFLDNYEEYITNTEYTTFYLFNSEEKISSIEERDGLIYLETVAPGDADL